MEQNNTTASVDAKIKYVSESEILKSVIKDLTDREKVGFKKYGTTVDRTDLTEVDWLQHAYEEALDMAVYLKKIIQDKKLSFEMSNVAITSVTFNGKTYNLVEASNESIKIEEVEEESKNSEKLEEPRKFNVGDKVRVANPLSNHQKHRKEDIVTVFNVYKDGVSDTDGFSWLYSELELVATTAGPPGQIMGDLEQN